MSLIHISFALSSVNISCLLIYTGKSPWDYKTTFAGESWPVCVYPPPPHTRVGVKCKPFHFAWQSNRLWFWLILSRFSCSQCWNGLSISTRLTYMAYYIHSCSTFRMFKNTARMSYNLTAVIHTCEEISLFISYLLDMIYMIYIYEDIIISL